MFVEERQSKILELLHRDGKLSVDHLVDEFHVSAPTIRADLSILEQKRLLRRTHGGALPADGTLHLSYQSLSGETTGQSSDGKQRIAKVAATRVRDHETILLDAGTTVLAMARFLHDRIGLTIVTNSLPAAHVLSEAGHNIVVIGGDYNIERRATYGPLATEFLRDMHIDRAFIGVNGASGESGWTVVDFAAVQVKRSMMARSREVVVVADHTKLGEPTFASIGPLNAAHVLITDMAVHRPSLQSALVSAGVTIIRCEAD